MSRLATNKLRGEFLKKLGDCVGKRDGGGVGGWGGWGLSQGNLVLPTEQKYIL